MAEVSKINIPLNRKIAMAFSKDISQLIKKNSLDNIKQIFETLEPEQCTSILNTTRKGCTPLSLAIKKNKVDISCYLLELSLRQGRYEMCQAWKKARHPLIATICTNNPYLVELISSNLWDINDDLYCPYTPLMLAVCSDNISYVKLMMELGAVTDLHTCNGRSILMFSTSRSNICRFLVVTTDVDLDHQDDEGDTALHIAVMGRYIESVKILVGAGAMNIPAIVYLNQNGGNSQLDMIEAMEVFNAFLVCDEQMIIIDWCRTLEMRRERFPKISSSRPLEILDFSTEFTTVRELIHLLDNPLFLAFQGMLVIERVLGRSSSTYLRVLLETALVAKHINNFDKFCQLIDYIEEFCEENLAVFVSACSSWFAVLFIEIADAADPNMFFKNRGLAIFRIITKTTGDTSLFLQDHLSNAPYVEDGRYSQLADISLYMATIIKNMNIPEQYLPPFYEAVVKLIVKDPRVVNQQSLLHRAIKLCKTESWGSVGLIRLLLECGAEVDSKDLFRRTPLMYALKHIPNNHIQEVVSLLVEYGCHVDCKDNEGVSVMNSKRWSSLPVSKNPRSLQCHAAEIILDNQINYEGESHTVLEEFLNLHKKKGEKRKE